MVYTRGQQAGLCPLPTLAVLLPLATLLPFRPLMWPLLEPRMLSPRPSQETTATRQPQQAVRILEWANHAFESETVSGDYAGSNSAFPEIPERSSHIGTHVGVATYPDNKLMFRTDTDESADEHHMRYGVSTDIRGDNGVFGTSGARAEAPAVLLDAYQGASQPVFQPSYMGHPVAFSGLNGQARVVDSSYRSGVRQVTGMPISAPAVTSVSTRAYYDVPKDDVRPRDHSAFVRAEPRDTLQRDKRLAQYTAKEMHEMTYM